MKVLLHSCCAPCTVGTMEILNKENIKPTIYWYNPNIHPLQEYIARRDSLKDFCQKEDLDLIIDDEYGLDNFCKNVCDDLETRCTKYCYPIRLKKVFEYAKENGFDTVSTTLLYSIYQKHDYIKFLCEKYSKEYGINFLYRDFREVFWDGHEKAKQYDLYMQKYCGCIYSEEESFIRKNV